MGNVYFLPSRESELLAWSLAFKTRLLADASTYSVSTQQATDYGALHDAFAAAYAAANSESSNSRSAILVKDQAKTALMNGARKLAAIIRAAPTTTPEMRADLGLTVPAMTPGVVPPPAAAPALLVKAVAGNTVQLRLLDAANPTRRGKPVTAEGAALFSFVGATAPVDVSAWKFEGNVSRPAVGVVFPAGTSPGAKVWFTAYWYNSRKEHGPMCDPVPASIPGGGAMAA